MLCATWNCFSIPFNVAFEPEVSHSKDYKTLQVMGSWLFIATNSVIDFLFLMDIIINFRTTFINSKTGDEITDTALVAKHYIRKSALSKLD